MTDNDIGRMTSGLRDNAKDIFDIWMFQPGRHEEFGKREIDDLRDIVYGLTAVIRQHDKQKLKVVSR